MPMVDVQCLHAQKDDIVASADSGNMEKARTHLAAKLRCASSLSCSDAVTCSDDTMILLRRVLGPRRRA